MKIAPVLPHNLRKLTSSVLGHQDSVCAYLQAQSCCDRGRHLFHTVFLAWQGCQCAFQEFTAQHICHQRHQRLRCRLHLHSPHLHSPLWPPHYSRQQLISQRQRSDQIYLPCQPCVQQISSKLIPPQEFREGLSVAGRGLSQLEQPLRQLQPSRPLSRCTPTSAGS